jgi:hypothetical protein
VSFTDLTPKSTTGNVPMIGELIPSRWSYEALAVTSFTDNAYEKPFFAIDKARQENQFYNMGFLYELQSQLETMNDKARRGKDVDPAHLRVIHTNLPVLTAFCGMEPYSGDDSYPALYAYLKEAEKILSKRGNALTLQKDALTRNIILKLGKEEFLELKKNNHNLQLENFVTGADNHRTLDIVDDHIVPRTGFIYLTPQSRIGRAPFYCSEKCLGSWHIKTLWFNLSVLLFMAVLATILLLTDYPGRLMRKE